MFRLEFTTSSDALSGDGQGAEVKRILHGVAHAVELLDATGGTIRDINGNFVGRWDLSEEGD